MIYSLSPKTWAWDFPQLPLEARLAWIAHPPSSTFLRLTADLFAFRSTSGSGVWKIGPLSEIIPLIEALPIPTPYSPPRPRPAESDPLDLSQLKIELDI